MIASAQMFAARLQQLDISRLEANRTHWAVKNVDVLQAGLFRFGAAPAPLTNRIFVVHGHDHALKDSVAELLAGFGVEPIILHREADRGRTIIEKFEQCADVGFAVVLMTPDDAVEGGGMRARQNVILELGYFIGKLGRNRVCALKKGRLEVPSDILGVLFTEVDDGGGWQAKLGRELLAAEYQIRG
jgi:predicted nucleotide-binding protein